MLINQADTAINSFHALGARGAAQRDRILKFIGDRRGSWSIGELSDALGMQKSTVSARLNELIHAGDIESKPKRRDRCSGITVRPVGLPAVQADLFGSPQ
jgi:DNA-binding MarR family transcriptional regulator